MDKFKYAIFEDEKGDLSLLIESGKNSFVIERDVIANVHITSTALASMVAYALEVYKCETFGLLLGTRKGKNFFVDTAIAHQTAARNTTGVCPSSRLFTLGRVIANCAAKDIVGDYHSHPDGGKSKGHTIPSWQDFDGADFNDLMVIVGINYRGKHKSPTKLLQKYEPKKIEWEQPDDGCVIQCRYGEFTLTFSAYSKIPGTEHVPAFLRRLKIHIKPDKTTCLGKKERVDGK